MDAFLEPLLRFLERDHERRTGQRLDRAAAEARGGGGGASGGSGGAGGGAGGEGGAGGADEEPATPPSGGRGALFDMAPPDGPADMALVEVRAVGWAGGHGPRRG